MWTDDMPGDPRVDPETFRQFPHQSDVFVPIRVKDQPVGGFFVIWWTERRSVNAVAALERRGGAEEAAACLRQIIHRQTHHLTRLVDDLLDVARATAGKVALDRQPLDLSEVAGGCVRSLRESGRARRTFCARGRTPSCA